VQATLLVELLSEELPPKPLGRLGSAFAEGVLKGLRERGLVAATEGRFFATPRRLAAQIGNVLDKGENRDTEVIGPSAKAPAQAVAGFARKHGIAVEQLERRETPKGDFFSQESRSKGAALDEALAEIVEQALKALPISENDALGRGARRSSCGRCTAWSCCTGRRVVPGSVLGLKAGNVTRGHRFMGASEIALRSAEEYEERLLKDGAVIADFTKRRDEIERQLLEAAKREGGSPGEHAELLDEVTALVELPSVYVGDSTARTLEVPQECLILTMRQNQKYFPLFDPAGKLLPKFLIVSNMKLADPRPIVGGNERVVRPRLEDARFFYNQDRKVRLEARVPAACPGRLPQPARQPARARRAHPAPGRQHRRAP